MMSSGLCSVAIEIVEPATTVGSSIANGVAAPVRPMLISMRLQHRDLLFGRELERRRPARKLRGVAEPLAQLRIVELDHHAVGLERRASPRLSRHDSQNSITASMPSHFFQCGSTGRPHVAMSVSIAACDRQTDSRRHQLIRPRREAAPGHQRRIEIPHRPGRGVARVGVERLARVLLFLVDALEVLLREIDLAAHFDAPLRPAAQRQRDRPHRAHVRRDLFAADAVAARGAAHQPAVFVGQRDAEAVDLELGDVGGRRLDRRGPCGRARRTRADRPRRRRCRG